MSGRKRVECPFCGREAAVLSGNDGKPFPHIRHRLDCELWGAGTAPRPKVRDCPREMVGITHGGRLSGF
jgi:hypothetical protein